jgi:hypothetical protein
VGNEASDATNEPLEVKLIAAASDGMVNVTPEKVEAIKRVLDFHRIDDPWGRAMYWAREHLKMKLSSCDRPCHCPLHEVAALIMEREISALKAESALAGADARLDEARWWVKAHPDDNSITDFLLQQEFADRIKVLTAELARLRAPKQVGEGGT